MVKLKYSDEFKKKHSLWNKEKVIYLLTILGIEMVELSKIYQNVCSIQTYNQLIAA
jgi:hypothetical protein